MRPLNAMDNVVALGILARSRRPNDRRIALSETRWGPGTVVFEQQMSFINSPKGIAALHKAGLARAMQTVLPAEAAPGDDLGAPCAPVS